MAYNVKRKAAMQRRSDSQLAQIAASGSLSSAAAEYELWARAQKKKETN